MRGNKQILLILSCGGMEFCWRYAWAFFLTLLLANRPFPLPAALSVFAMASVITAGGVHTRWRFYQIPVFHILGFSTGWLLTAHLLFYDNKPFFSLSWISNWLGQLQAPGNWLIQLSVLACLLLFWRGACAMVKRPATYYPVCLQFDKGLGAIFMLLLVKFTMELKGGLFIKDTITPYLLVAFMVTSLMAISLSRNQSGAQKSYRPGYHHIGIVLSFMSIILLVSAVLSLLFLPYLTLMADSAQIILKETTAPLGNVLTNIIRFLFSIGRYRREIGGQIAGGAPGKLYPDSEIAWAQGLGWVLFGVIGLLALWFCCYMIGWLIQRFLKRKTGDIPGLSTMDLISRILVAIGTVFLGAWNGLLSFLKRIDSAASVYAGMLRWGRRSGLPAAVSETPIEYGTRLKQRFPQLNSEIEQIIRAFNREIYGQMPSDHAALSGIQSARRRMRNPRHWPSRVKAWFAMPSRVGRASK